MNTLKLILNLSLLCLPFWGSEVLAQSPLWGFTCGSKTVNDGRACVVAPNGNVYFAGTFTGTMDIDPSAAVYNITSNGQSDVYLACYAASGAFLWGFNVGGNSYDGIINLTVDSMNNAIICGYYRGKNVNFDPAGAAYLSDNGILGGFLMVGGDGFVAKYSPAGAYLWAIGLGGKSVYDIAEAVATDKAGNVYVGGDFHFIMDIDPGPGVKLLDASTGTGFLIKYKPNGQLDWGINFGAAGNNGDDNTVWGIKVSKGYVYFAGSYSKQGNFNPAGSAILPNSGGLDAYIAKYDVSGNYQFAYQIGGRGDESAYDISLDSLDNIYITGSTTSATLKFSPLVAGTLFAPGHGVNGDAFFAKYNSAGIYQWAHIMGSGGDESGYGILISRSTLFLTGYFQDTVDFDPSAGIANLVSNGKVDVFMGKYDLDGNYQCSFNVGGPMVDVGRKLAADKAGDIYVCGQTSNINVDFDPDTSKYLLSSNGINDAFLVKYNWSIVEGPPAGYLIGDTVCEGKPVHLVFVSTAGRPPFTIVYTNGYRNDTLSNIGKHTLISISPAPDTSTAYKLTFIREAGVCPPLAFPDTTATVIVHPRPFASAGPDTVVCPGKPFKLLGEGGESGFWYPKAGIDSPDSYHPEAVINTPTTYYFVVRDGFGCTDTATKHINIIGVNFAVTPPKDICIGDSTTLGAFGADEYLWGPDNAIANANTATPEVHPTASTVYNVKLTEHTCNRTAVLSVPLIVHDLPVVKVTEVFDVDCGKPSGQLVVEGAKDYEWSPGFGLSNAHIPNPTVAPVVNTVYTVIGTDEFGCSNMDSALVSVFPVGNGRLFAPTAFTPNGDGKNECFKVHIPGNVSDFELSVFDRWGNRVFFSYDYNACWEGSFNGEALPLGTYFYSFKAFSSKCGGIKSKGDVILIR